MNRYFLYIIFILIIAASCTGKQQDADTIEGTWRCAENNPVLGQRTYLVDIERSQSDTTKYLISNFYNLDYNEFVFAYLSGNSLAIPQQVVMNLALKWGFGTISQDLLSVELTYNIIEEANDIRVTAILTRP